MKKTTIFFAFIFFINIFKTSLLADSQIKIGMILPLTDSRSSTGIDAKKGALLAIDVLKKEQNLEKLPFQIIFEDSRADSRLGITAYKKLKAEGVNFFITHFSAVSLPISKLVNKDNVIQLAIATTSDKYSKADDLTFRLNGPTKFEAQHMIKFLSNVHKKSPGNIAIITMEDEYPLILSQNVVKELKLNNLTISYEDNFHPDSFDFRALISKLKSKKITYVILLSYQTEAGYFVKQAKEQNLTTELIMTNTPVNNKEFFEASGRYSDGIYVTYIKQNEKHPATKKYLNMYKEKPNIFAANGYDAIFILNEAYKKCDYKNNIICLKKALYAIKDYNGLTGLKSFDDIFGDMQDEYSILVSKNGAFSSIQ